MGEHPGGVCVAPAPLLHKGQAMTFPSALYSPTVIQDHDTHSQASIMQAARHLQLHGLPSILESPQGWMMHWTATPTCITHTTPRRIGTHGNLLVSIDYTDPSTPCTDVWMDAQEYHHPVEQALRLLAIQYLYAAPHRADHPTGVMWAMQSRQSLHTPAEVRAHRMPILIAGLAMIPPDRARDVLRSQSMLPTDIHNVPAMRLAVDALHAQYPQASKRMCAQVLDWLAHGYVCVDAD